MIATDPPDVTAWLAASIRAALTAAGILTAESDFVATCAPSRKRRPEAASVRVTAAVAGIPIWSVKAYPNPGLFDTRRIATAQAAIGGLGAVRVPRIVAQWEDQHWAFIAEEYIPDALDLNALLAAGLTTHEEARDVQGRIIRAIHAQPPVGPGRDEEERQALCEAIAAAPLLAEQRDRLLRWTQDNYLLISHPPVWTTRDYIPSNILRAPTGTEGQDEWWLVDFDLACLTSLLWFDALRAARLSPWGIAYWSPEWGGPGGGVVQAMLCKLIEWELQRRVVDEYACHLEHPALQVAADAWDRLVGFTQDSDHGHALSGDPGRDALQVFWDVGGGFQEVDSHTVTWPADGIGAERHIHVRSALPARALRLDPSNGPCAFDLLAVTLHTAEGPLDYPLDDAVVGIGTAAARMDAGLLIAAFDRDPQVILPLPGPPRVIHAISIIGTKHVGIDEVAAATLAEQSQLPMSAFAALQEAGRNGHHVQMARERRLRLQLLTRQHLFEKRLLAQMAGLEERLAGAQERARLAERRADAAESDRVSSQVTSLQASAAASAATTALRDALVRAEAAERQAASAGAAGEEALQRLRKLETALRHEESAHMLLESRLTELVEERKDLALRESEMQGQFAAALGDLEARLAASLEQQQSLRAAHSEHQSTAAELLERAQVKEQQLHMRGRRIEIESEQQVRRAQDALTTARADADALACAVARWSRTTVWRFAGLAGLLAKGGRRPLRLPGLLRDWWTIVAAKRFDPVYYLKSAPDVAAAGVDPLVHYLLNGTREGRNPCREFDNHAFLTEHPLLAKGQRNPFAHWIRAGCPPRPGPGRSAEAVGGAAALPTPSIAPDVTIIIPTLNGGELFGRSLEVLTGQAYAGRVQILVVDSSSTDGTELRARAAGAEVTRIAREDFHHARTRQMALGMASHGIVVYFVQDAVPTSDRWLQHIVDALVAHPEAVACYGKQLPHEDADLFARFETTYHANYLGDRPRLQSPAPDARREDYGESLFRHRFDNVCAAYRRDALAACPFPDVLFAEDIAWAKAALGRGWSVLYHPDVTVRHSHNRPPRYRFQRGFVDTISCARILGKPGLAGPLMQSPAHFDALAALAERTERDLLDACARHRGLSRIDATQLHQALTTKPEDDWGRFLVGQTVHVLTLIGGMFPDASEAEYAACVRQSTALAHGCALGGVLANHELAGAVPDWLRERLNPLFKGV